MDRLPLLVGAGALGAYLWSRGQRQGAAAPRVLTKQALTSLSGRWVWPVPTWNERRPKISDGIGTPRPGGQTHRGVDIMYARGSKDPYAPGTPNGSAGHVMPDGIVALAASDGLVWSAGQTQRGYSVVIDHSPAVPVATYYTHLEKLLVAPTSRAKAGQRVRAGDPIGIISFDPLDGSRLKHLLCAALHNRCNAERPLCGAPRRCGLFRSGCARSAAHNAGPPEVLEPGKQVTRRESVVRHLRKRLRHGRDRGLLHTEVDLDVPVCGRELCVAEPRCDGRDVYTGVEEVHSCRVTKHVRRHGLRVPCRHIRSSDQSLQNVGDARPTQTFTSSIEEQGFPFSADAALVEPGADRLYGARPKRARPLLAPLADDHHVWDRIEADVGDVQVDEFLDAQAGVVQHEHECSIAKPPTCICRFDDARHLVFVEVAHLDVLGAGQGQLADPAAPLHVLGCRRRDVSSKGFDRRESVIASARPAPALAFEVFEERAHDNDIECSVVELLRAATQPSTRVAKEQLEGVAIGEHGVAARIPLGGEVTLEEALHERLQRGCR